MKHYWTGDSHLGHANIIKYCNRPFKNIEEHDETIISNYNSIIQSQDIVYCLGDFSFKDPDKYLSRLNGCWILVKGNHDPKEIYNAKFQFVKDVYSTTINGQNIFMSHYAHRVWNRAHYGAWHLYGHSHSTLPDFGKSCDVGVDNWNYKPVSFEQLQDRFKDVENIKHH